MTDHIEEHDAQPGDDQHTDTPDVDTESSGDVKAAEEQNAEVQAQVDKELAQGFRGSVPDPRSNDEYALTSGPDAPPLAETNAEARNT